MKGIKLTPFLLFVILLVVLVLAMLFGTTLAPILENMDTQTGTTWESITASKSIKSYNSGIALITVDADTGLYFDSSNGNLVISADITSPVYTLLPRDSNGVALDVTQSSQSSTLKTNIIPTTAPWSYTLGTMTIIYCPHDTRTVVIILDNDNIKSMFRNKGTDNEQIVVSVATGITKPVAATVYSQLGNQAKQSITYTGKEIEVTKISKNVFYSNNLGIIVGSTNQTNSTKFENGISVQNTDEILVISTLMDTSIILSAIIVKDPTTTNYKIASANYIPYIKPVLPTEPYASEIDEDVISIKFANNNDNENNNDNSNSSSNSSCNSQLAPNTNSTNPSANNGDLSNNSDYIRKSEIVPPVCPGCPPCPNITPNTCNLSINSKGEMIDCTGKKYVPENELPGASPGTWEGSLGKSVSSSVGSVAGVAKKGLSETGNLANKTLDTASGAFDKTLDTASGLASGLGKGVGSVASGLGKGLAGLGTDASEMVQGVSSDVAGLGNNVINSTTGLAEDAGSGLMQLSQQQQYQQMMQQPGYMQPGSGYGYPTQQPGMGYGYPTQQPGMGYSYPQQCPKTTSNFMPITNDFSQFA